MNSTIVTTTNTNQIAELAILDTGSIYDIAFSPDGSMIAIPNYNDVIQLWNVQNHTLQQSILGSSSYVHSVAFSPDGTRLVSGDVVGTVRLWNPRTGKEIQTVAEDYTGTVAALIFNPAGTLLAFEGGDISRCT